MHEVNARLFYKAQFTLPCPAECADTLFEQVLSHLFRHYAERSACHIPFSQFRIHARLEADDHSTKTRIASFRTDTPSPRSVWSLEFRFPDASHRRRRWVEHFCVQHTGGEAVTLTYALLYYNNLARSFASLAPPSLGTPAFVRDFLCDEAFFCAVGAYRVPHTALALSHGTLAMFVDLLLRDAGSVPVILIAGTDLLPPLELAEAILGNGIVFYTDDEQALERANAHLPDCLRVSMHTVHFFPPGKPYVQVYGADVVLRMGSARLMSILRTGLCEYMDHAERANLVTVSEVHSLRSAYRITESIIQINTFKQDISNLRNRNSTLQDLNIELKQRIEQAEAQVENDPYADAEQYLDEWNKCQDFYQSTQEQINEVTTALYTRQPVSLSAMPQNAAVAHLVEAVKFRLGQQPGQRAQDKPKDSAP